MCTARDALTPRDWYLFEFAGRVSDQFFNQAPFADKPVLSPRLEGYEAALRLYGYHPDDWADLAEWGSWLHHLRVKTRSPMDLVRELTRTPQRPMGKSLAELTWEDCRDDAPYA